MLHGSFPAPAASRLRSAWLRAGLTTGVTDGLFSTVLSMFFYGSTASRLFQGVASVLLGPKALDGGTSTALVGLLMHFCVAFGWSAVFVVTVSRSARVRDLLHTPSGPVAIASLYGPAIWMAMSLILIPLLTHRPPAITFRWWVQFFGHVPFVGLPIAAATKSALR